MRDNLTTASAECGAWRSDAEMNEQSSIVSNSQRTMRIGTTEIPWTGILHSTNSESHYGGDFYYPMQYTGGVSSNGTLNNRMTRLVYADARYDLAVYEIATLTSAGGGAGSYNQDMSVYPVASSHHNTSSVRVIMSSPGHTETLFEHEEPEDFGGTAEGVVGTIPLGFGCAQQPMGADYSNNQSTMRDAGANNDSYTWMAGLGSYAVDREGRIGASQRIIFLTPVVEDHGYWHHLTQGNLPGLLPGTPPQEGYGYDIRLIR